MKKIISREKTMRYLIFTLLCLAFWLTGCVEKVVIREQVATPDIAQAQTIFFDDFSQASQNINRNLWMSNGKAHWVWQGKTSDAPGCVDGCLKQNSEADRALNAIMYISTPQISNATIETKTRINYDLSIGHTDEELKKFRYFIGTGIVFRLVDDNNYYMFRLAGEEGCVLGKMVDGRWVDLKNPRRLNFLEGGRVRTNTWYTLKVIVNGNNIQCFINDSPVINYTDFESEFSLGHFGLTTFKCFGDFEYIKVTK
ncbi:MAG: hypothetical protein JXR80_05185 [Deltaproteobacteria bacterium]|nr:hypothetical protein [Deltaproteobacteria bacterium]